MQIAYADRISSGTDVYRENGREFVGQIDQGSALVIEEEKERGMERDLMSSTHATHYSVQCVATVVSEPMGAGEFEGRFVYIAVDCSGRLVQRHGNELLLFRDTGVGAEEI